MMAKWPLAKCPLAKCPLAKCLLAKCPLAKCPDTNRHTYIHPSMYISALRGPGFGSKPGPARSPIITLFFNKN